MFVPSNGSTAMSTSGPLPVPSSSPIYNIGASSSSPSPITTVPAMFTESNISRIAVVAASSASFFFPRPIHCADANAAASVTRTISSASSRSKIPFLQFQKSYKYNYNKLRGKGEFEKLSIFSEESVTIKM